jgi:hypothetical protein
MRQYGWVAQMVCLMDLGLSYSKSGRQFSQPSVKKSAPTDSYGQRKRYLNNKTLFVGFIDGQCCMTERQ